MLKEIDYLVIGHVTKDILPGTGKTSRPFTIGGTVTYASLTARNLGLRVGVVTSAQDDFPFLPLYGGVTVHRVPAPTTTTFKNIYHADGSRAQFISDVAATITAQDIPPEWRAAPIVHLGPLNQEVSPELVSLFPSSLIGVTPQGWLRQWDTQGRVSYCDWQKANAVLNRADVLIFSAADVENKTARVNDLVTRARIAVLTQNSRGATVYQQQKPRRYPARPATEVDSTGAGDVFAAAFLVRLHEMRDISQAAYFANVTASLSIEKQGVAGIPARPVVEDELRLSMRNIVKSGT